MIESMNHFTVLSDDLQRTLDFYVGALGLEVGPRPDFNFKGAWLYAGGRPILHVVVRGPLPSQRAGVLDHMAFTARDLGGIKQRLDALGVGYEVRRLPDGRAWQLFCIDPSGAKVELDFDAAEAA